jgi:acyl-CoA thioester hydrolase
MRGPVPTGATLGRERLAPSPTHVFPGSVLSWVFAIIAAMQTNPTGMINRQPHTVELRPRYAETDQMGVIYHANYLVWMELGRTELCKACGFNYKDMEKDGVFLAVVEANCRYHSPARYDDLIAVETVMAEANRRMVRFEYEIRNADTGKVLSRGFTRHVFCNEKMMPASLPEKYYGLFGVGQDRAGNDEN